MTAWLFLSGPEKNVRRELPGKALRRFTRTFPRERNRSPARAAWQELGFFRWADRGTTPFGNLAIPSLLGNGPMALRPTLTDGLPLSWNTIDGAVATPDFRQEIRMTRSQESDGTILTRSALSFYTTLGRHFRAVK